MRHAGSEPPEAAAVVAAKAAFARKAAAHAQAAAAALARVPPEATALLLPLRVGLRRWRLNAADWRALADAAVKKEVSAIPRIALQVQLRGALLRARPAARRNPHLLGALDTGVLQLPPKDTAELLERWPTLGAAAAERAVARVLRHGALRPRDHRAPGKQEALFVGAGLTQVRRLYALRSNPSVVLAGTPPPRALTWRPPHAGGRAGSRRMARYRGIL